MRMTGNWTRKARAVAALSLPALAAATAGSGASAQSVAFIEQVGDNNQASIDQSDGTGSTASAQFKGSANLLDVSQGGRDNGAVVSVTGSRNGRGDVVGGTGRSMAFATRTLTAYGVSHGNSGNNGNNGQGNPCGGGNGNGTGNPCNGNNGNSNGNGNAGDNNNAAPLTFTLTPLAGLESGVIRQQGQRNLAGVLIAGDSNDFHVSQLGNDNKAAQALSGSFNQAAIVQGTPDGPTGNGNAAVQAQRGVGNSAYAHQAGNNNIAVEVQAGSTGATKPWAEAALATAGTLAGAAGNASYAQSAEAVLASYSARGDGTGNSITLQQNGDNNTALLGQFGNDNSIALRQPGNAYAAVTQLGDNHSIGIDQRAGTNGVSPITVTQY
jgi:trimeric autotransporter adhesin